MKRWLPVLSLFFVLPSRASVLPAHAFVALSHASAQTTPARDQRAPAQTGAAVIRGRVVAGDSGRPLRRAQVRVSAPELKDARTATTNADGRYEIKDLPAGRYTITVTRSGYLQLKYGQRRPYEQAKPLQVADRQVLDHIDFAVPRMSVISGRVFDETGDPIEGVTILAMRTLFINGHRRLVPVGSSFGSRTDDEGGYRITGLAPGTYVVLARTQEKWTVDENGTPTTFGYAPTYCPGVTDVAEARKVTVGVGTQAAGLDFALIPGRAVTISGTAFTSRGRPFGNVSLGIEVRSPNFGSFNSAFSTAVRPDGTFSIPNVSPGDYVLSARTTDHVDGAPEVAILPLLVGSTDIDNIALIGTFGGTVSGRVVTDGDPVPSTPRIRITIMERFLGQPPPAMVGTFRDAGFAQVNDDGMFTVTNVIGQARFDVTLPDGWAVKAIVSDGRDVTDSPIELKSGQELTGVQVLITNHLASVIGQVTDRNGSPITDGTVIAFSTDSAHWFDASRFIKAGRPDQEGQVRIKGLPPGDYHVVAVEYVEDGAWFDPEYLESLRQHARKLTLEEAGTQTISLRILPAER